MTLKPIYRTVFDGECKNEEHFPESRCDEDDTWLTNSITVIVEKGDFRDWFCVSETKPISASALLEEGKIDISIAKQPSSLNLITTHMHKFNLIF